MSSIDLSDAEGDLAALIDRAFRGEVIVIRRGSDAVELRAIEAHGARTIGSDDLTWLESRRVRPAKPPIDDAASLISQLRDEGEH